MSAFKIEVKRCFQILEVYSKIYQPSLAFLEYMKEIEKVDFTEKNTDFFKEIMYRCKV